MSYSACLDVHYDARFAHACAVVFELGPPERVVAEYCHVIHDVEDYVPGEFYRRELPCLLAIYGCIKESLDLIFIDGYVWLGDGRKGLGAYLYGDVPGAIPVIGVAKSPFAGGSGHALVYRGESRKPLYVTSVGIELDEAASTVRNLGGGHRIPEVLKRADRLSRSRYGGSREDPAPPME